MIFLGKDVGCSEAVDASGDGSADIDDAICILFFLFDGGPPIPAPFPACGSSGDPGIDCWRAPACP